MNETHIANRRSHSSARARAAKRSPTLLKTENIQIRVTPDMKRLVEQAAEIVGTSVSEFSMQVIRQAAENEILNRRFLTLKTANFDQFVSILDSPPKLSVQAKERLRRKSVWDTA